MLSYSEPSTYDWVDDTGNRRIVSQAQGSEQGDPLMPLLFSIGIQGALEKVSGSLEVGELLCTFLDDIYFLCEPDRVRPLFDLLAEALMRHAAIQRHQGKKRAWNRSGTLPVDVNTLGDEVAVGWDQTPEFVTHQMEGRLAEERRLWEAIPHVPDLQCAAHPAPKFKPPRQPHHENPASQALSTVRTGA